MARNSTTTIMSLRSRPNSLFPDSLQDSTSIPPTPVIFEFGEACLVSMAPCNNLKRTSSVDGITEPPMWPNATRFAPSAVLKQSYSTMCLRDGPPIMKYDRSVTPPSIRSQPRTVTVKASKRNLKNLVLAPTTPLQNASTMVDKGCSPMQWEHSTVEAQPVKSLPLSAQPLVEAIESLISSVDEERRREILEAVMKGYRNSFYTLKTAQRAGSQVSPSVSPPTPASTPPPMVRSDSLAKKHSAQYSVKPELVRGISRPISLEADDFEIERTRTKSVDQILALGCGDGVDKSLWTSIVARVEGLGLPKEGSGVGKFDMQYLMTTAMETFTTLPLSHQALHNSNPFSSPDKLAKLFIPHLERYLSSNPSVRFLIITFPSSSLNSMTALRSLLGSTMKVAMVSGSLSSPFGSTHGNSSSPKTNKLSNEATLALNSRKRVPLSRLGNSKAQALLGNEAIPKPMAFKKSSAISSQSSRTSLEDKLQGEEIDFALALPAEKTKLLIERSIDEFVEGILNALIDKDPIYASSVLMAPQLAIANWSAATPSTSSRQHSPNSSISSSSKGRRLTKQRTADTDTAPPKGILRTTSISQTRSQASNDSRASPQKPVTFEAPPRNNTDSGEWQKLYLEIGEGLDNFSLGASAPWATHSAANSASTSAPNKNRKYAMKSRFNYDSDTDDEEEMEEMFLPRQGQSTGRGEMRTGTPGKRDIGKALRMLGIA